VDGLADRGRLSVMASPLTSLRTLAATALLALFAATMLLAGTAAPVGAQDDGSTTIQTTSTLPTDNRELGNSLPKPGQGMEPQDAGDPGGFLQVSLFFLICAAIVVIGLLVWRSSHRARSRRSAAGLDPVATARARGEGVRRAGPDAP
jgi:hypothetical protein